MADASNITVNIDAAIHATLHDMLQEWATTHGVRVTEVNAYWSVARTIANDISFQELITLRVVTESL